MPKIFMLLTLLILVCACSSNDNNSTFKKAVFKEIHLEYATCFKLYKNEQSYKLELINPNSNQIEKTYLLNMNEDSDLKIPVQQIVSLSSTFNGMFSILKATNHIVGISNIHYVYSPEIKKGFETGKILELGDESNYSIEKIVQSGAKLILYSGFGKEFPNEDKLNQLGIQTLPIYDWRETHPLGKAEWIKLIGILTGKYNESSTYFDRVKGEYYKFVNLAKKTSFKPSILSGILIGDIWYAPAGDSYMAKLFKDSGGDYIYKQTKGTGSTERSLEKILEENTSTIYWLNPGYDTKAKLLNVNSKLKHLPAYQKGIYCYSGNMSKFWERSASEPHLMLSDLIHIFHPEIEEISGLHFYTNIIN